MKSVLVTILFFLPTTLVYSQAPVPISWQHPEGLYGGIIYSMVDNGNGRLFVATEGDGVFNSSDNGETWTEANNGLTNSIVYCLAANSSGQVFAGTEGDGIFRLDVENFTWTAINSGLITTLSSFAIINSIVVNDSGHVFAAVLFRGIFRSTDNGENWMPVNSGLSDLDVLAIAVNNNNELFVSTFSSGIFKSTNNGVTWVNKGLSGSGQKLYAILALPNQEIYTGRWRSTDNGENWFPTSTAQANISFWSFLRTVGGETYTTTNAGVFKYESSLWIRVGTSIPEMTTFTVIQRTNGDIFAGSGGMGVYKLDSNNEWSPKTRGITNIDIRSLTRGAGNDVYAASFFSGIFRSTDNGATWSRTLVNVNLLRSVCITVTPSGSLLAGTWRIVDTEAGKIFRSTDNGTTWTKVFQPNAFNTDIQTFTITPNGDIFAGTVGDSLYKSTDDGLTWSIVHTNGLTSAVFVSLSTNSAGHLFAGTLANGLMRSSDNGMNWSSAQNGLPVAVPGTLDYPFVRSMIFTAGGEAFAATDGGGVFSSLNNGANWVPVNTNLTNLFVRSLSINEQGDIFAATEYGVFRMIKNSENWSRVVNGLSNTYVRAVLTTNSGHVLAGTWGSGMFRTVSPTTDVQQLSADIPQNFSLDQNYPNPFNPTTNIAFRIASSGVVTLKIFDILGKEVATILSETLQPGSYSIPWDASSIPSGVYFYRLQAGSFSAVKRAVVLK